MEHFLTRAHFEEAAAAVRAGTRHAPSVGVVLGSGLGGLADSLEDADILPASDIPHWPHSTVPGHVGRLVLGRLEGQVVLAQQGRVHFYEGISMQQATLPVRVMQLLGVHTLILTNAAGAVNQAFTPGDLMVITDHINIMGMAGVSPLRGPNDESLGARFPDMSQVYDRGLRALALDAAAEAGLAVQQGVYICLGGPAFETPADLRFLRGMGADAVGMSTVPEATVARHGGLRVLGISGISNAANLDGDTLTTHEEVLAAGDVIVPKLTAVIRGVLRRLTVPPRA